MSSRRGAFLVLLACCWPGALPAQTWNDPQVAQLIRRAILLREAPTADSALQSYRSQAHGFVFTLTQFGPGFPDPPQVIKADQLDVEVYWEAPATSKQRITAWRNGYFLPFETTYHRDHLGIVTNNFGPIIRIGEGDEVRDAVHPLSLEGLGEYDFALGDTLTLRTGRGDLEVLTVQVRPRSVQRPLVVGLLYLERRTAALVRFQFSFTPSAYRDKDIEDISVVLEQSLLENRWWLPYRQEIEIRRRSSVFEFPLRFIIKGRWEIDGYELGAPFPEALRTAPEYGGLATPTSDTTHWTEPLRAAAEAAQPFDRRELESLKNQAQDLVSRQLLEGLPRQRFGATAVSDLIRVNRVQGLALGFGLGYRFDYGYQVRGTLGYGLADHRVTASLALGFTRGRNDWSIEARRIIRDIGDEPIVSGVINSFLAQEFAIDLGSYLLGEEAGIGLHRRLDPRWSLDLAGRFEHSASVETRARPLRREYQENPALGSGSYLLGRLALSLAARGALDRSDIKVRLGAEGGTGESSYLRLSFRSDGSVPVGFGHLRLRTLAGVATSGLPKARSFIIGGRGTLPGEVVRGYGGRRVLAAQVEWRLPVPVPALGLGPFATTGNRATLAPLFGVGWSGGAIAGLPWGASQGPRPVIGVAAELLQGLVRIEAARRLRHRPGDPPEPVLRITIDVSPEWWPIL